MGSLGKAFDGERLGRWTLIQAYTDRAGWCIAQCACGFVKPAHRGMLRRRASQNLVECAACAYARRVLPIGTQREGRTLVGRNENGTFRVSCNDCGHVTTQGLSARNGCIECRRASAIAPAHVRAATGVSRQAINQRIERGWTREEATTLPKGMRPARLEQRRAA